MIQFNSSRVAKTPKFPEKIKNTWPQCPHWWMSSWLRLKCVCVCVRGKKKGKDVLWWVFGDCLNILYRGAILFCSSTSLSRYSLKFRLRCVVCHVVWGKHGAKQVFQSMKGDIKMQPIRLIEVIHLWLSVAVLSADGSPCCMLAWIWTMSRIHLESRATVTNINSQSALYLGVNFSTGDFKHSRLSWL